MLAIDRTKPQFIAAVNEFHSYEVFHPMDRPGQLNGAMAIMKSKKQWVLVDAPVGSGKTSFAAWASKYCKVLTLVEKKSLQAQYVRYGFTSLPGKNAFECNNHYKRYPVPQTAENCLFDRDAKICQQCDLPPAPPQPDFAVEYCQHKRVKCVALCKNNCPYSWAKAAFFASPRSVSNYTKWLLDMTLRNYDNQMSPAPRPDILFLDEAHKLGQILTDFKSIELTMPEGVDLPEIAKIDGVYLPHKVNNDDCLLKLIEIKTAEAQLEPTKKEKEAYPEKFIRWERKIKKLSEIIDQVEADIDNVYFEIANDKLIVKFLSPDFSYFDGIQKVVMMTATPTAVIKELGLDEEDVEIIKIDSAFSYSDRRVWTFENAPRLNYKDFKNQTDNFKLMCHMAAVIFDEYQDWTGVVHLASYSQCEAMESYLSNTKGKGYFISLPRGVPTDEQMVWWQDRKGEGYRACLTPVWAEGVDLPNDNINLIAKTYFEPAFQDGTFTKAKRMNDQKLFNLRMGRVLEQQVGRTQRGEDEHYGPKNSFIGILDGNWTRLRKHLSPDFIARMQEWKD